MKQQCYWVSWLKETRLPKENGKSQLVKVEGLGRWIRVWMKEFKQDHVGELIVKGWAANYFNVSFDVVQVLRMPMDDIEPLPIKPYGFRRPASNTWLLSIILLLLLSSCSSGGWYWHATRRTATGKVSYVKPGWPKDHSCSTYYSSQPVKQSTVRRLHFYRNHKRQ